MRLSVYDIHTHIHTHICPCSQERKPSDLHAFAYLARTHPYPLHTHCTHTHTHTNTHTSYSYIMCRICLIYTHNHSHLPLYSFFLVHVYALCFMLYSVGGWYRFAHMVIFLGPWLVAMPLSVQLLYNGSRLWREREKASEDTRTRTKNDRGLSCVCARVLLVTWH